MKAFGLSALISGVLSSAWVGALWQAGQRHHDALMIVLLGGYGVVVALAALVSASVFKEKRWQAACGSLAVSSAFICVIAALVAWHHYTTTGL